MEQHNLDLRNYRPERPVTHIAGKYEGLDGGRMQAAVLDDMKAAGILRRQDKHEQRVGTCWRCKTPIEIMSERQCS